MLVYHKYLQDKYLKIKFQKVITNFTMNSSK